ncbi:MAG: FAD-binding dehydrogenase [Bacteroidales bacterium]|nr:FAD-binding dehydrogenase [Bacteroidales bacterium]
MKELKADVLIAGGGIAGIVAAIELIEHNKTVLIFDRDKEENFGGLAKESFGGMFYVNSPQQKRSGIKDNKNLAKTDWFSFAEFEDEQSWGALWAEKFINSTEKVYQWLTSKKVSYFPVVHWVERGLFKPGNSVPRFHMVWGTGYGLITALIEYLKKHKNVHLLQCFFEHKVENLITNGGEIEGLEVRNEKNGEILKVLAPSVIIATGGINGSMEKVRKYWHKDWGSPPDVILNGSHQFALGDMHEASEKIGANITHLDKMWNYAAGIRHFRPKRANHGLSLVPPKSALWLNHKGERIGPLPLITAYDTRYLVTKICEQEKKYSWQVLNKKIALKELAVSGSEFNDGIKEKKILKFLSSLLLGNKDFYKELEKHSEDFIIAYSIEELAEKMNQLTGDASVDVAILRKTIEDYDRNIARGKKFHNDEQLRRIAHARQYRGDKVRTCKFQKINDKKAYPLIAIREFIVSRKSLGGIQTDLHSRVLQKPDETGNQKIIKGLYAAGEAAGFGGGGSHGLRALEGTFLGTCVLTAKTAAEHIVNS